MPVIQISVNAKHIDIHIHIDRAYAVTGSVIIIPVIVIVCYRAVTIIISVLENDEDLRTQNSFQRIKPVIPPPVWIHPVVRIPGMERRKLPVQVKNHRDLRPRKPEFAEKRIPIDIDYTLVIIVIEILVISVIIIVFGIFIIIFIRKVKIIVLIGPVLWIVIAVSILRIILRRNQSPYRQR